MSKRMNAVLSGRLILAICIFMCLLVLAEPSHAAFTVRPMKIEFNAYPNQRLRTSILLQNMDLDEGETLELKLVDLSQRSNGEWEMIESDSETDLSFSCREWLKLSATHIEVPPKRSVSVTLNIKVPPRVRGFYCAAIIAQIAPKPGTTGVAINVRFGIPILIEIYRGAMRQEIELSDLVLESVPQTIDGPSTTLASMVIKNSGKTFSQLRGNILLKSFSNDRWRTVTKAAIKNVSILPGVELNLKSDIERPLPPGKYKLEGYLLVNGRRAKPLKKEIDFAGDPSIKRAVFDAAVNLEPSTVFIGSVPGASRMGVLRVSNTSDTDIDVIPILNIPPSLAGVSLGEVRGEELSCSNWIKVKPERFTIRGGGTQNIRIVATMPKTVIRANYYARLSLRASYTDGQNAGTTNATICVKNKKSDNNPRGQVLSLNIASAGTGSEYLIASKVGNVGNVHIVPVCSAYLRTDSGRPMKRIPLSGDSSLMLPMEFRDFSGLIDFSEFGEGLYYIRTFINYGRDSSPASSQELPLQVTIGTNGRRIVEVVQPTK